MKLIIIGLLVLLGLGKGLTIGGDSPKELIPIYKKYGEIYSVDWKLLRAIAQAESDENPDATNYSDPSYGLMQILYPNHLPAVNDWPPASADDLYDPDYNVKIGAQIIAWNIKNYGYQRGIAIYNAWEARNSPVFGPFPNEVYVNKVLTNVRKLDEGVPDDIY